MSAAEMLDAIEARVNAATPATGGPTWVAEVGMAGGGEVYTGPLSNESSDVAFTDKMADAAFIAASRTDVPALVAALRAVLKVCDEIEPNSFGDVLIEADDIIRAITSALDPA